MNGGWGPLRKFYVGLAMLALGGPSLGGCADLHRALQPAAVNPESPVAAQARAAVRRQYVTPRLADVPPVPRNVPLAPAIKTDVIAMVRCRRGVASFALTHPPLTTGTEQFATNERDVAQVGQFAPPPPDAAVQSDAVAADMRAYASPPLALASGPPPQPSDASPNPPPVAATPARSPRARPGPSTPAAVPATSAAAPPSRIVVVSAQSAPPLPGPQPDPLLAHCS